jgi:hypothetical protein
MQTSDDGKTNLKALTEAAVGAKSTTTWSPVAADSWPQTIDRLGVHSSNAEQVDRWNLLQCFLASGPDLPRRVR